MFFFHVIMCKILIYFLFRRWFYRYITVHGVKQDWTEMRHTMIFKTLTNHVMFCFITSYFCKSINKTCNILSYFTGGTKCIVLFYQIILLQKKNIFSYFTGGTIDITVHEVQQDGHLKELYHANGGAWGGTFVDKVGVPSFIFYDLTHI